MKVLMEYGSYDISVDTQSNLAYEYYVRVFVAFLINPYI